MLAPCHESGRRCGDCLLCSEARRPFRHSAKATLALQNEQTTRKKPKRKLIQDVSTRRNSTYYMLQRLLDEHIPVVAVLNDRAVSSKDNPSLDLSPSQWMLAEDLVELLKPFEAATRLLSLEKNVSVSCILPIALGLWRVLSVIESDSAPIKELKTSLISQLEDRHQLDSLDGESIPVLASFLDPYFKVFLFLTQITAK